MLLQVEVTIVFPASLQTSSTQSLAFKYEQLT